MADQATAAGLQFPPLNDGQKTKLRDALGPKVALANPLDYHTYIWRDEDAMTRAWRSFVDPGLAITLLIVDFPRGDRCDPKDWDCAINAAIRLKADTGAVIAMVATLPELMPEQVAQTLMAHGVVPFSGLSSAIRAISLAQRRSYNDTAALPAGGPRQAIVITEMDAKRALWAFGLSIPPGAVLNDRSDLSPVADLGFPVVAKTLGLAHKTGASGIALNLASPEEVADAVSDLAPGPVLVEEMIADPVTELLIGVVRDPAHGFVLTIGAGGTLAELLADSASLLIPASPEEIEAALGSLRIAPLLAGYRGKPAVDRAAILAAIEAVQAYVIDNADTLEEIEINPLICTSTDAVAADALIRKAP